MSTNVKVGSARIDENGKATGGKAGDQTGKEVSTQAWYLHSKGWVVLRAKDPIVAEKIAQDMQYACDNANIGYDQNQRNTLYNAAKAVSFNCSKVTTKCETDCSALVRVCLAYAGINVASFRTTDEAKVLLATGKFTEMTGTKYTSQANYLCRGDILVTKTQGHTVVVLNNGKNAEDRTEPVDFNKVLVTGGSVYVRVGPDKSKLDIGIAHKGDVFDYLGVTTGTWYKIKYKGYDAYISSKYSILSHQ